MPWSRRDVCLGLAAGLAMSPARAQTYRTPIVFVHGNGDTAGLWLTTLWRFESNLYPRDLLFPIDLRYPEARSVDAVPQAGRSSTDDVRAQLAAYVADVRDRTGAARVALVGQSRGGNTVRNYLKNAGGAALTDSAVLCGAPCHGVIASDHLLVGSEFNGLSAFLRDLNSTPGEVVAGVRFATLRSDHEDKYAQPDGALLGLPGVPTGVSYAGPALQGAANTVLPGADHRETGYAPQAFAAMFRHITGAIAATTDCVPEAEPVLDGKISGFQDGAPTNIGIAGAEVAIYAVLPATGERLGAPRHRRTTGADGIWGPFKAEADAFYEFEVAVPGYPITHIYRSPFARSSACVHMRPQIPGEEAQGAGSVVYMSRPRGYFGLPRDHVRLDGVQPAGIPTGVPTVSLVSRASPVEPPRSVSGVFNREAITVRTWKLAERRVSVIELTY
jgi:pimeloyl-ACP methyl ester carboxylesterase